MISHVALPTGLAAAITQVLAGSEHAIPALAILITCCRSV